VEEVGEEATAGGESSSNVFRPSQRGVGAWLDGMLLQNVCTDLIHTLQSLNVTNNIQYPVFDF
jgi:hypothetical protein